MARTKQTARKSCGGKAPRKMMAAGSAQQLRQFLTGRQVASHAPSTGGGVKQEKVSYINYENMFYSYSFPTGQAVTQPFKPCFTAGGGRSPVTGEQEQWVGMSFNSMYDGKGMKTHGRPHLNLAIVLDVSGSMGSPFDQDSQWHGGVDKLTVAKQCLQSLTDQLKPSDQFGLVRFNNVADVHCPLREWSKVNKSKLKKEIDALRAYGTTCLSAAIDCATDMFSEAGEHSHASSRVVFLTDLCSTVDSANDEKRLLNTIKTNADRGIYTTVVGIGMDLNVRLVEEISKTRGAKYCSVDSAEEFTRIMKQEFDYDVTILAFNIRVQLLTPDYILAKGYGSPELHNLKPGKPVVISSEFPCWQDDKGQSKGGMMLFKLGTKKGKKNPPKEIKIKVTWEDLTGVDHTETHTVKLGNTFKDSGTRKAALLVHYVDLHNDYVHDRRQNKVKFLELFQTFRSHFIQELEEMKDKTLATSNKGDLELLDKIIQLESQPEPSAPSTSQNSGSLFGTAALLPFNPFSSSSSSTTIFGSPIPSSPSRPKPVRGGRAQVLASHGHGPRTRAPKRLQRGAKLAVQPAQSKQVRIKSPPASTPVRRSSRIAARTPTATTPPAPRARSRKRLPSAQDQQPPPAKRPLTQPPPAKRPLTQSSKPATGPGKGKAGRTAGRAVGRKAANTVMRGGKKVNKRSSKTTKQVTSKRSGKQARKK